MQIGSLVKHKDYGFIGVLRMQQLDSPNWFVIWSDDVWNCWCNEVELEVLCE